MITGQSFDDDVKLIIRKDEVVMDVRCMDESMILTGEAALKIGHALIDAGEKSLEKAGKIKNGD